LVRGVDFLVENVLKVGLKQGLTEVNLIRHAELVELIKFDEGHAEAVETALESILLPILQLDFEIVLDEMEEVVVGETIVLGKEELPEFDLELGVLSELLAQLEAELLESDDVPPVGCEDDLVVGCKRVVLCHNDLGKGDGGLPNLVLVVPEVDLVTALALEVDVEPESELAGQHHQVVQPVEVQRGENNKRHLIVRQPDLLLYLTHLRTQSLDIMNFYLIFASILKRFLNKFLLLI